MTSQTRPSSQSTRSLQRIRSIDVGRLIMGFNVMLVGVLCWLWQLGHLSRTQLFGFWPLALVGLGLASYFGPQREPGVPPEGDERKTRSGLGLVVAGVVLILGNLFLPAPYALEIWLGIFPLRLSLPLLLMIVGGYMIWRDRHPVAKKRTCSCGSKRCRC